MVLRKKSEILLLVVFAFFSGWLMWKSFSYDNRIQEFVIARNEVGDFGLHLSLIRSFSWGNNYPVQSPFYPGPSLPYHYGFDLFAGLLERAGLRIDYAVNGISVVFFTLLLYLIYKIPKLLFHTGSMAGIFSVIFFVCASNLSFLEFFNGKSLSVSLIQQFWRLPDYINKGPFDGSVISIFSSLNPYLNQRHLIVGMALSVFVILFITRKLMRNEKIFSSMMVVIGILLGLSTRIHLLLAFGTGMTLCCLLLVYKRPRLIIPLAAFAFLFALPHISEILALSGNMSRTFLNLGFLAARPLTLVSFLNFWWLNEGLALIFIPLGVFWSGKEQRKFFLAILPLFVIPNIFQISFRVEHNYSLIELFFILCLPFLIYSLSVLWKKALVGKCVVMVSLVGLTLSGFLNIMVVKNDFHFRVADAGSSPFMQWIKQHTAPDTVFLSPQNLYDPVTLSGRRSYFGATYYLEVMGYDVGSRRGTTKDFFEARSFSTVQGMRATGIQYVVVPNRPVSDFPYVVSVQFFRKNMSTAYKDNQVTVFQL